MAVEMVRKKIKLLDRFQSLLKHRKSIGNLQTISPVLKATIRDSIQKVNFFFSIPILFQDWKIVALISAIKTNKM